MSRTRNQNSSLANRSSVEVPAGEVSLRDAPDGRPKRRSVSFSKQRELPASDQLTCTSMSAPASQSASRIRSNLLHSLGIESADSPTALQHSRRMPSRTPESRLHPFHERLKADYGLPDKTVASSESSSCEDTCSSGSVFSSYDSSVSSHSRHNCKSVTFDSAVTVHPIPSRADYSDRIRSVLWHAATEMQENAARNYYEFVAEGFDWRTVVDDEDMVVVGDERIHPVHFAAAPQDCSLRRQFVTVLSAQQQQVCK